MIAAPLFDTPKSPKRRRNKHPSGLLMVDQAMVDAVAPLEGVPTDMNVLMLGESGVGKSALAKWVAESSGHTRFKARSAATIPPGLQASILFGHCRGAFTGADRAKGGWFHHAHDGTLFIDEVAELSLPAQAAMLQVLDTGQVVKVGNAVQEPVDVRLITATSRDLTAMVKRGEFRADLYWRLAELVVTIPPLRERPDDVVMLAKQFAGSITEDALVLLAAADWPGNVRQLKSVVRVASHLAEGDTVREDHVIRALDQHAAVVDAVKGAA